MKSANSAVAFRKIGCERLPHLDSFTELRANEVHEVWLIGDEAIIGMDVVARGPWIVPQSRGEATGGCPAKGTEFNHGAFTGVNIAGQLVEQFALLQAEQA